MRIGIIGVGVMGEHHIRIYSEIENNNSDVHIVGIADINKKHIFMKSTTLCRNDGLSIDINQGIGLIGEAIVGKIRKLKVISIISVKI